MEAFRFGFDPNMPPAFKSWRSVHRDRSIEQLVALRCGCPRDDLRDLLEDEAALSTASTQIEAAAAGGHPDPQSALVFLYEAPE